MAYQTKSNINFSGYLEPSEVRKIIDMVSQVSRNPDRDRLLLELMWQTGGRVSEVIQLKPEHIGVNSIILRNLKQVIRIRKGGALQVHSDKSAMKEVVVSKTLCEDLKYYCKLNRIERGNWVFQSPSNKDKPLSRWAVWYILKLMSEKAGVFHKGKNNPRSKSRFKGAYPHLLRHSSAMKQLEETNNIMLVKQQLGHSNVSTTQIYAYVKDTNIKKAISKINWYDKE